MAGKGGGAAEMTVRWLDGRPANPDIGRPDHEPAPRSPVHSRSVGRRILVRAGQATIRYSCSRPSSRCSPRRRASCGSASSVIYERSPVGPQCRWMSIGGWDGSDVVMRSERTESTVCLHGRTWQKGDRAHRGSGCRPNLSIGNTWKMAVGRQVRRAKVTAPSR